MKKLLCISLTILMLLSLVPAATAAETVSKAGDVNFDGEITSDDARFILRAAIALEELNSDTRMLADIDGNEAIEAIDARLCIRAAIGLEMLPIIETNIPLVPSTVIYEPSDGEITAVCELDEYSSKGVLTLDIYDWNKFCNGDFILHYDDSITVTNVKVGYYAYGMGCSYMDIRTGDIRFAYVISQIDDKTPVNSKLITVSFEYDASEEFSFTLTGKARFEDKYVTFNDTVAEYEISTDEPSTNEPTTDEPTTEEVATENENPVTPECSHICHKDGFFGFIWKVINFFQKLFGISPVCECGKAHY